MVSDETLEPAPDAFVLTLEGPGRDLLARAQRLGPVERVESASRMCVIRVAPGKTPRDAWEAAVRALAADVPLFPVFHDRDGAPHYPTGEVTVRFDVAPSDPELRQFCDAQGLRLLRRNEFVAQQVVCAPVDALREFLPDLVGRLAAQPGVRRAWANTLSRYRRK